MVDMRKYLSQLKESTSYNFAMRKLIKSKKLIVSITRSKIDNVISKVGQLNSMDANKIDDNSSIKVYGCFKISKNKF